MLKKKQGKLLPLLTGPVSYKSNPGLPKNWMVKSTGYKKFNPIITPVPKTKIATLKSYSNGIGVGP